MRRRAAAAIQQTEIPAQESYDYHMLTSAEIAPLNPQWRRDSSPLAKLLILLNRF
jgi:hypothetical protein